MSDDGFQVNEYAERIAIIDHVKRTEDYRYVEVFGVWSDSGETFENQFLPADLRLSRNDRVYVLQQTAGLGKRGGWVAFTSDQYPGVKCVYNAPRLKEKSLFDIAGAAINVLIEIGAVVALAVVAWEYSWWAAAIIAVAAAYIAWQKPIKNISLDAQRRQSRRDEERLFVEADARLSQMKRDFVLEHEQQSRDERSRNNDESTGESGLPTIIDWRTALELPPECSLSDAEAAYRKAMKDVHPDLNRTASPRVKWLVEKDARLLNDAIEEARRYFGKP